MRKTFKYRIYPSKRQTKLLKEQLRECRWLYNRLLEERKKSWEEKGESLSCYKQHAIYPALKQERPSLRKVHSQVLQNIAVRIDLAFKAFFRRCKVGEKPGYPRFRGRNRYDSFTYPQSGFKVDEESSTIKLSKIGKLKIILHRPIEGKIKTCNIRKTSTGKWFVTFSCEWESIPLPESKEAIGIDLGIKRFLTATDGAYIPNPRFFAQEEKALAKAQRALARAEKGTKLREKKRKTIARIHERTRWKREDFAHQQSRKMVNKYGLIAVEDLNIKRMIDKDHSKSKGLRKSISEIAWNQFIEFLSYKAEWADRKIIKINPAYSSQDCSDCGYRQEMPLAKRHYDCLNCNLSLDRDHNAARNILALGRQCLDLALAKS